MSRSNPAVTTAGTATAPHNASIIEPAPPDDRSTRMRIDANIITEFWIVNRASERTSRIPLPEWFAWYSFEVRPPQQPQENFSLLENCRDTAMVAASVNIAAPMDPDRGQKMIDAAIAHSPPTTKRPICLSNLGVKTSRMTSRKSCGEITFAVADATKRAARGHCIRGTIVPPTKDPMIPRRRGRERNSHSQHEHRLATPTETALRCCSDSMLSLNPQWAPCRTHKPSSFVGRLRSSGLPGR